MDAAEITRVRDDDASEATDSPQPPQRREYKKIK
jgi:hypothetical protein